MHTDYTPIPGQLRAGAHTDYGVLTILKSGGPGLQAKKDEGNGPEEERWIDIPFVEDAFIINIGDLMQRWTNGKWKSTLHRVLLPSPYDVKNRRQSMAFFVNINGDTYVETIETCIDDENPVKYKPVRAADYLKMKHLASNSMGDEL